MAFRKQYLKNGTNKNNKVLVKSRLGRRRRQRRTRRSRGRGMYYVETMQFMLDSGATEANQIKIKVGNLSSRPKGCNFRVRYVQGSFSVVHGEPAKAYAATIDIRINNPIDAQQAYCASTGPKLLGLLPRSFKIHNPRSSDWVAENEVNETVLAEVHVGCIGKAAATKVYGLLHVLVDFGPKMLPDSCPVIGYLEAEPGPSGSSGPGSPGPSGYEVIQGMEAISM